MFMEKRRKIVSLVSALVLAAGVMVPAAAENAADEVKAAGGPVVEYLNRGISAINTGSGMLVSWRLNADDPDEAVFKLYRDDQLIYTSDAGKATCYLDKSGKSSSKYRVETLSGSSLLSSEECMISSDNNYLNIRLEKPTGNGCTYSPNDVSVGDVDGDGQYEIFLKWDPSNSKDNSQSGETGNVFIDCYTLEGKRLWRIDLGRNIRAGQHYTQFLVADFDGDGKAEMTCKTADGTVDGTGKVIGDKSKNYRNGSGYILDGPEYYTLFDGATGKALDTVNYEFPRGNVNGWGDKYGNRVDRFLGAVCYFEDDHPTAVSVRGYYTRMTAVAYDVKNKKLVKRWAFDSGNDRAKGYGGGNHNCMPADVDGDGRQELFLGAVCIDDDGKLKWANGRGHGDAMHLGDLDPDRKGLEAWVCHEEKGQYGVTLLDAATGKAIFHKDHTKDTGRCCGDNVLASNRGAELWGAESGNVYDTAGKTISTKRPAQSFLIYWDGDPEREILDGTQISKLKSTNDLSAIFTANGCVSINGTKNNPCVTADLFGDWREEAVWPTSDGNNLRIYATSYTTNVRMTTLMHEPQYRNQVACEQTAYNQPAHTAFYLGSELKTMPKPSVQVRGSKTPAVPKEPVKPIEGAQKAADGKLYMIKNVNSGLYLDIEGGSAVNAANVYQASGKDLRPSLTWKTVSAGDGYFYLVSGAGDGTIGLDVNAKKADNGTNIQLYTLNNGNNQQFKFIENEDGSYRIATKISGDASCIEIINAYTDEGANVQEWELNGHACQNWVLESAEGKIPSVTEAPVTASVTEKVTEATTEAAVTTVSPVTSSDPVTEAPVTTVSETAVTTSPVTSAKMPEPVNLGDYDNNGLVDITDLTELSLSLVDRKTLSADVKTRMDVDGNGTVDLADLAALRQFISKKITTFR